LKVDASCGRNFKGQCMPSLFNIKRNDKNSKANIQIFVVPNLYFFMVKSTGKKAQGRLAL